MTKGQIRPGELWLDTAGKPIQAHMARIFFENGVYYWYGSDKTFSKGDISVWHWGVRCYRSTDLCNWDDLGHIIPPDIENPDSVLAPRSMLDRPHIVRSPATGKYVCWFDGCDTGNAVVLESDSLLGPYRIVHASLRLKEMEFGDFDLVVCDDGKGYCYFNHRHTELICAELTEDMTAFTGKYSTHFPTAGPPDTREAPAWFMRNGKHYLITSGTTCFCPNPSMAAVGDYFHGPFLELGNPHRHDESMTSFHSQLSQVFHVPGKKELYIALADRWLPDEMDVPWEYAQELFRKICDPNQKPSKELIAEVQTTYTKDTSGSRYVWLPLCFEEDKVYIDWLSAWSPEQFE